MSELKKVLVCASDWLDQTRSNDPMKGRVVLLKWINEKTGEINKFSTHEQWEQSDKENWESPSNPNYCYGEYFDSITSITDEIQQNYYKRAFKLLNHYGDKPKLNIIDLKSRDSPIVATEQDIEEFQALLRKRMENGNASI